MPSPGELPAAGQGLQQPGQAALTHASGMRGLRPRVLGIFCPCPQRASSPPFSSVLCPLPTQADLDGFHQPGGRTALAKREGGRTWEGAAFSVGGRVRLRGPQLPLGRHVPQLQLLPTAAPRGADCSPLRPAPLPSAPRWLLLSAHRSGSSPHLSLRGAASASRGDRDLDVQPPPAPGSRGRGQWDFPAVKSPPCEEMPQAGDRRQGQ